MSRSDTAIITPFGLFNYGNRLQNYAVDRILQRSGHTAETLVFPCRSAKAVVAISLGEAKRFLKAPKTWIKRRRAFKRFSSMIRVRRVLGTNKSNNKLNDEYDIFVVGSDQVWNPRHVKWGGAEYANFAEPGKVVCLAPSFGISDIPSSTEDMIRKYLANVRSISVREQSGIEIIQTVIKREPRLLCDPTLMLDAEEWREVASDDYTPATPYILAYMLGKDAALSAKIEGFARDRGLSLVLLTDSAQSGHVPAGPQHFLSLISHSQCVITDSFHAVVFSQIFGRDVYVFPRAGGEEMTSRMDTLFDNLGMLPIDSKELEGTKEVRFEEDRFQERLTLQRQAFEQFLQESDLEAMELQ